MKIPLNVRVQCIDGLGGRSTHVILNPLKQVVTHFVVTENSFPFTEYLVPVDQIIETTADGIRLCYTRAELAAQPSFTETHYQRVEYPDYENASYLMWPYALSMTTEWFPVTEEAIPLGEQAVQRGAEVDATDGRVGQVDEFLVDPRTMHISHLVVRQGHLWRQRDITIPIAQVKRFDEETVTLKLDKQAVAALPTLPIYRPVVADPLAPMAVLSEEVDEWVAAWEAERAEARQKRYGGIEETLRHWDAKVQALQAQIDAVDRASDTEIYKEMIALYDEQNAARAKFYHNLEEQLEARQTEIDRLEVQTAQATAEAETQISEQIKTLRAERAAAWQELNLTLRDQIQDLRSQLRNLELQAANAPAQTRAAIDQQVDKVRTQLREARQKLHQAIETQITETEAELGELQVQATLAGMDLRAELDEQNAKLRARRHALRWQIIHLIQDQIQLLEAELDEMQVQFALAKMDVSDALAQQNAALQSKYQAVRAKLIYTIEEQVQAVEAEIGHVQVQAALARAEAKDEYAHLLSNLHARRTALRQKLTQAVKGQQQAWITEIQRLRVEMEKLETNVRLDYARRIAALKAAWATMQAKLLDNLNAQLQQVNTEIQTLEANLTTAGANTRRALEDRLTALRIRRDALVTELQTNVEAQLQAWDAEIDELNEKLLAASADTKKQIEARIERLRIERDSTRTKLQKQMETQLQAMQADITELKTQAAQSRTAAEAVIDAQAYRLRDRWQTLWERLERNLEADIAAMDEASMMILEGVAAMAAEDRAEQERRTAARKARYQATQAHLHELRQSSQAARRDIDEGLGKARADMREAVQKAKAEYSA